MNHKAVLQCQSVSRHFELAGDRVQVLNDVSFDIQKGNMASIVGKSGSGKTTLLNLMAGLDDPNSGDVYMAGQSIKGLSDKHRAALRNKHMGFVFQFHYLLSEFSVLENVMLPAKKLAEKSYQEIEYDAFEKLKMLNIEHLAKKRASQVSGGEKQRIAIARALINNPSIIMGDEPTGNLDSHNAENVFNIFKKLSIEQGLSLLIVTHDDDFANKTDRIIQMADGKII